MKTSLGLLLILCCAACIQLGGTPQQQTFYLLSPQAETTDDNPLALNLHIGQINFPPYLDRPQIVTRTTSDTLQIANEDRWAEPLQDNLARVLKEDLIRKMNGLNISSYPWEPITEQGLILNLTVNQFDGTLGLNTHVDIRWKLSHSDNGRQLVQRHFIAKLPIGESITALVAGLSAATEQLSKEISQELIRLNR